MGRPGIIIHIGYSLFNWLYKNQKFIRFEKVTSKYHCKFVGILCDNPKCRSSIRLYLSSKAKVSSKVATTFGSEFFKSFKNLCFNTSWKSNCDSLRGEGNRILTFLEYFLLFSLFRFFSGIGLKTENTWNFKVKSDVFSKLKFG